MKNSSALLGSLLVTFLACCSAWGGYPIAPSVGPAGPEITAEFRSYFEGRGAISREALLPYRIVFVPGFNADYLERNYGYFAEQRKELLRLGLIEGVNFEMLRRQNGFHGERSMSENAAAVTQYLLQSPKPVLLISHSKGAIDVLEALLNSREARTKVKGWFSIQAAMGGTVLADVLSKGWARPFVEGFLRNYGGSIEALEDMKRGLRQSYLEKNLSSIEELLREVPVVALTTQKDYQDMPIDLQTLVFLFDPHYLRNESDGMIEIKDSMIPFAPYVFLKGVDHGETTQKGIFKRVRLLHSMLSLLLQRAR